MFPGLYCHPLSFWLGLGFQHTGILIESTDRSVLHGLLVRVNWVSFHFPVDLIAFASRSHRDLRTRTPREKQAVLQLGVSARRCFQSLKTIDPAIPPVSPLLTVAPRLHAGHCLLVRVAERTAPVTPGHTYCARSHVWGQQKFPGSECLPLGWKWCWFARCPKGFRCFAPMAHGST